MQIVHMSYSIADRVTIAQVEVVKGTTIAVNIPDSIAALESDAEATRYVRRILKRRLKQARQAMSAREGVRFSVHDQARPFVNPACGFFGRKGKN